MTLATSAMLVSLRVRQWSARKYDRSASEQVCEANDAKRTAGNFNKQLIDKLDLKPIQRVVNSARNYHYQNTLAWDHDGADMLPAKHYRTYISKMADYKNEFDTEVDTFIKSYPELLTTVMNTLGELYNTKDYPSQDTLRTKFSMNVSVTPIPEEGDFRVDLSKKESDKLKKELGERLVNANQAAERDLYMRLYTCVAKAVVVLSTPDKIFRNSLVLNIIEFCNKIPDLNFNENTQLDLMAKTIGTIVSDIKIDDLRIDDGVYRTLIKEKLEFQLKNIEGEYIERWGEL